MQNHATWNQFQLTPSRRATCTSSDHPNPSVYFNSRPHGGRQVADTAIFLSSISTHALTEGDCDVRRYVRICTCISTHALTEGDGWKKLRKQKQKISTHALTEGDEDQRIQPGLVDISTHALTEGDNEKLI